MQSSVRQENTDLARAPYRADFAASERDAVLASLMAKDPVGIYVKAFASSFGNLGWNKKIRSEEELRTYTRAAIDITRRWHENSSDWVDPTKTHIHEIGDLTLRLLWAEERKSPVVYGVPVGQLYDTLSAAYQAPDLSMMDVLSAMQKIPENPKSPKGVEEMVAFELRSRGKISERSEKKDNLGFIASQS